MGSLRFFLIFTLLLPFSLGQECFVKGECHGQLVGIAPSDGENDCLATCKNTTDCYWFTWDPVGVCNLFLICDELDPESCPECSSGEGLLSLR